MNSFRYTLPLSISLAALCIALAIIAVDAKERGARERNQQQVREELYRRDTHIRPLNGKMDLIRGNPEAEVIIIEYGDLQCPFCKSQHPHLQRLLRDEYVLSGAVAWVFRHFPHLDEFSFLKAELIECTREYANDKAAWEVLDHIIAYPIARELPIEYIKEVNEKIGVNTEQVLSCVKNGEKKDFIISEQKEALRYGATRTPFTTIITKKLGVHFESNGGVYEYDELSRLIDEVFDSLRTSGKSHVDLHTSQ